MKIRTFAKTRTAFCCTALAIVIITLGSCDGQAPTDAPTSDTPSASTALDLSQAELQFWKAVQEHVALTHSASKTLEENIAELLSTPIAEQLVLTQRTLFETRLSIATLFALTQLQRAAPETLSDTDRLLYRIQAYPIQPGFLDRFGPYRYSGLVFDIGFSLSSSSLRQQHGLTDSEEVVLGIHAIAFMLLGENNSRSAKDYIAVTTLSEKHREQKLSSVREVPNNRRRLLLELQARQLSEDLMSLRKQYSDTDNGDLSRWRALSPQQQVSKMRAALQAGVTANMVKLAELQNTINAQETNTTGTVDAAHSVTPSPEQNDTKQYVRILAAEIASLKSMTMYLSDIERQAAIAAFTDAETQLLEHDFSIDSDRSATTTTKMLQNVYNALKSAR